MKPMRSEIRKEIDQIINRMDHVNVEPAFKEFESLFERGNPLILTGLKILEESGNDTLADWIDEEMLKFLRRRENLEQGNLERRHQFEKAVYRKSVERNTEKTERKAMSKEELKLKLIKNYQIEHPEVSPKDCVLAVSKSKPELFRWGSA